MKEKKVSLIIPVYNGENYIEEAITSALNQTYKNIEIIVVDDGSKDNTEQICRKYSSKIRYYKKENGGVATALNYAISKMTGDYFSWLSHDDLYYPNKIEEELNFANDNTIVFSDYDLIDEKGISYSNIVINHEVANAKNGYALFNGLLNGITLLIPKKAFDKCGEFKKELWCTQDYDMWFRFLCDGFVFKHVDKILASSRQHRNQTTNSSPKVITEGNVLWKRFIDEMPDSIINELYGSKYSMYYDMYMFLKDTVYAEASKYVLDLLEKNRNKLKNYKQKVSVIMPIYDESLDTIKRALNSIKNQTYKNIEIILINDNPDYFNDNDIKLLINEFNFVYVKNKANMGVSYSRNIGIKKATGDYIAFLDADDEYLSNKIEIQLKEMILNNADISHCSYNRIGKETIYINSGIQHGYIIPVAIYNCVVATPCVMISKSLALKYSFNEEYFVGEDSCMWLNVAINNKIIGIDVPLVNVYVDEDSAAYNNKKHIIGIKNIIKFVCENEVLFKYDDAFVKLIGGDPVLKANSYELNAILNSKSWKITAPLRLFSKTLKSLKCNGIIGTCKKIKRYLCKK